MDESAITKIQESTTQAEIIEYLEDHPTNKPILISPENFDILELEQYMEHRSSYRFTFKTESISDFIQYGIDFDQVGAACFVDSSHIVAKTVFDLGTREEPLHQQHTAFLHLSETAAFSKLLFVDGARLSQKQASDFIEDWVDNITVYSTAGDFMHTKKAAASLRDLTIESAREINTKVDDYSESMSQMEKVEAKNKHLLPSEINFSCVPYLHLEKRDFTIRISLITSGDAPQLSFRIIKLESIKEEIAEEFKGILIDGFEKCKTKVYMGSA